MLKKTILPIYALIYTLVTIYFIYDIKRNESASLGYIITFPLFWLFAALLLGIIMWVIKINNFSKLDIFSIIFSTPLPVFIFILIWSLIPSFNERTSTFEFNKNGYRIREIRIEYPNGKPKRIEYYKSIDKVTDENPFPINDTWIKDSIWIFYNRNGEAELINDYRIIEKNKK